MSFGQFLLLSLTVCIWAVVSLATFINYFTKDAHTVPVSRRLVRAFPKATTWPFFFARDVVGVFPEEVEKNE